MAPPSVPGGHRFFLSRGSPTPFALFCGYFERKLASCFLRLQFVIRTRGRTRFLVDSELVGLEVRIRRDLGRWS